MDPTNSANEPDAVKNEEVTAAPPATDDATEPVAPSNQTEAPTNVQKETYSAVVPDEILSFECISGSVPFEDIYNSQERKDDPLHDLVHFPEDNLVLETFTKFHRSQYAATPEVNGVPCVRRECFPDLSFLWVPA